MTSARRPIAARQSRLSARAAEFLLRAGLSPNQVSVLSVAFAALGALALLAAPERPWLFLLALLGTQLRLLCNLLDGMMAVEGGRSSPLGALYNEFPDRVADTLLIVALGYAVGEGWLGWAGALAAALTAYVRAFGGALGQKQDFRGPMAKQHRMAVLSAACLLALLEALVSGTGYALLLAAWAILLGSLLTCWTRARAVAGRLLAAGKPSP